MGHAGRIMEDTSDEGDVYYTQTWLKRFGEGRENIISHILQYFGKECGCSSFLSENLLEAKLKFQIDVLGRGDVIQPTIDHVTGLSVITLMQMTMRRGKQRETICTVWGKKENHEV